MNMKGIESDIVFLIIILLLLIIAFIALVIWYPQILGELGDSISKWFSKIGYKMYGG